MTNIQDSTVEWGKVGPISKEHMIGEAAMSIVKNYEFYGEKALDTAHGVYLQGTEIVLCKTGNSPNSPEHARRISALWNACKGIPTGAIEAGIIEFSVKQSGQDYLAEWKATHKEDPQ